MPDLIIIIVFQIFHDFQATTSQNSVGLLVVVFKGRALEERLRHGKDNKILSSLTDLRRKAVAVTERQWLRKVHVYSNERPWDKTIS